MTNGKLHRRERIVAPPSWASIALMVLLASSATTMTTHSSNSVFVDAAFTLPRLHQNRIHGSSARVMAVRPAVGQKKVLLQPQKSLEASSGKDEDSSKNDNVSDKEDASASVQQKKLKDVLRNGKSPPPGSPLSMICEEAKAAEEDPFEIHVGRALDTLRSDYPHMLTAQPDFKIFDKDVEVIDPSGVKLHGLKNYKNAFRLMHAIVQLFYCPERSGLTFRMCYDKARQNIRVSWNAEVIPKAIFGGVRTTLHVDGISVYEICRESGMITQHRIERLIMNDEALQPKQGIFAMLRSEHDESVPVFNSLAMEDDRTTKMGLPLSSSLSTDSYFGGILEFRQASEISLFTSETSSSDNKLSSTSLAAVSAGDGNDGDSEDAAHSGSMADMVAFEKKNAYRKKFGLKPITLEEFMENEAIVKKMESHQRQRAASASAAAEETLRNQSRQQGFFEKIFGNIIPETCESNFDCQRPELCCDFGFKKICCASGTPVGNQLQPAMVRVPVDIADRPGEQPRPF